MKLGQPEDDLPPYHPGPLLAQNRINLGLTMSEAASLCDMHANMWSRIERGMVRHPEWATVCRMLGGMGIEVSLSYARTLERNTL